MRKKNLIKRSLVYALTGSMLFSNISPAFAYTYKDSESSFTVQDVNEDKTSNTTVYAEVGSAFKVTIPKHIILDGTTKSGAYTVNVTGDIAGTEVVSVVPDKSFALKSNFLNDVTATINQDKTEWSYNEILENNAVIGNGVIDAKDITAGSWNGNFNFNIKLENNLVNQKGLTLSVNDNVALGVEDSLQVDAYINGVKSNDVVTWESNNENITVNNGLIETKASAQVGNTATITVTAQDQTELTAMQTALSDLGLVTYASATDDLSIDFVVTIVDIEYSVDELNLKAGESIDVTAKIIPEDINGTVSWSQTAISGINLVKNGNTVTIKVADNMEVSKSYDLIATYGDYSKILKINIVENEAHMHNYEEEVTQEATCTEAGVKTYTCTCGDLYTESIDATGHNYENGTCTECGDAQILEAGLYDANDVMLCNWEESGIDVETDYSTSSILSNYYKETKTSPYYVLDDKYPTAVKIVLPNSVISIGKSAFYDCNNLTSITIPNSVTSIGSYAFSDCDNLTSITLPDGITNIANYTFENCTSLTSVTIPDNVSNIGEHVFDGCTSLINITIPDSVTSIGKMAFRYCRSLTSIVIPNNVTDIGHATFSSCTNLTNVTIPSSVTSIGNSAFYACESLTEITIPNSVTQIGNEAFSSCTNLTNVTIPSSVTSIGKSAFYNCTNLTSVTFTDTTTWYVGSSAGATTTKATVTNASTNATYLTSTYYNKYWTKQ